jgi:hypothetical protein
MMMTSKINASLAVQHALLKRNRHPFLGSSLPPTSSWERETGRGIYHVFGEYHLDISTCYGGTTKVVIQEDCSSIATRVWDCSVVTTKWLEHQALVLGEMDEKESLSSSLSSSSTSSSSPLNLHNALRLPSSTKDSSRPPLQVLELGSGMGLLSICLAKMGAAVLSTEYGSAVTHLQKNCERNHVTRSRDSSLCSNTTLTPGRVVCRELDWYKTTETLQSLFPKEADRAVFDLIAVTDCSLSIKDSMGVLDMIRKYGTVGHTKVLVGLCLEREGTSFFVERAMTLFPNDVTTIPTGEYPAEFLTTRHTILLIQL